MGTPVIKFMFRSEWRVIFDATQLNPSYETVDVGSASDLINLLNGTSAGMIVTSIQDKNDLVQLATLVKLSKKLAPSVMIKIMVINFSGDKQFEKAIIRLGIMDLIDHRIQTKALRFKIDFMMKSLNAHIKKTFFAQLAAAPTSGKTIEQTKASDKIDLELHPKWGAPIEVNDIWILKNDSDCKRVLTRWLVKFMGPGPYVANWVETETPGTWKFEFKNLREQFLTGDGAWFFKGDHKPDFIWTENVWSITGSSFDLFFKDGTETFSRLQLKDRQITIAKNSETAKSKEESIFRSMNKDLLFVRESSYDSASESIEVDPENYKNLQGKGGTDFIDADPLSGKNKTETLNSKPLSGKSSTSHLNTDPLKLGLKQGENSSATDPLSMDSSSDKRSSFWKGKNPYEKDAAKKLGVKTDAQISQGPELGMATSTEHKKRPKNHNKAEKFAERDPGVTLKKEGVGENLQGTSSTDEIESHLSSLNSHSGAGKAPTRDAASSKMKDETRGPAMPSSKNSSNISTDDTTEQTEAPEEEAQVPKRETTIPVYGVKKTASPKAAQTKDERESAFEDDSNVVDISSRKKDSFSPIQELDKNFEEASETAVVTAVLTQGLLKSSCQLDDFFDETMIFRSQTAGFEVEKPVSVYMKFSYLSKDTLLNCAGTVTLVEIPDENFQYVSVKVSEVNDSKIKAFMKLFDQRQGNVDLFLKTVKGN